MQYLRTLTTLRESFKESSKYLTRNKLQKELFNI